VKLTLPYPVSANRYWRSYVPKGWTRPVVVVSPEAKAYKERAGWIAKAAGLRNPVAGLVEVRLKLFPRDKRLLDIDNAIKVAIDALAGIAYVNDKQVNKVSAERCNPDGNPRLEVEVLELGPLA